MDLETRIRLWNHSHIHIIDIRRSRMRAQEALRSYRLPSSAYIYVLFGQALIQLDEERTAASAHMLLHGGKGTVLSIVPEDDFHYYMILYKATPSLPKSRELLTLLDTSSPFQERFCMTVRSPVLLEQKLLEMDAAWHRPDSSGKLLVRASFYQFVNELLEQFEEWGALEAEAETNVALQAVRYIEEHYHEPITLELLEELLGCNSRMLLRKFRAEWNTTPIDYLIQIRLGKAKELLAGTWSAVKDIAEQVGYTDHYYFSRLFKKHTGMSPLQYRASAASGTVAEYDPSLMSRLSIAGSRLQRYIGNGINNHYQYRKRGEYTMYSKSRMSVAVLLLCFAIMLGACGGGNAGTNTNPANGGTANQSSTQAATQTPKTDASGSESRVVKHAMGEETIVGTPERVVVLTNEGTEALLSVGVKPIGAVQSWVGDPWYDHIADKMENVEILGDELQPNLEMIASLKPDLIIGNKVRQEKIYEQLKQIAPTVFSEDLAGDWKINFELYMQALNKEAEGQRLMDEFDKRVAEAKVKLADKLATKVSIVRFSASQVRIYQKQSFSGVLLQQLGFARPESQDKDSFIEVMSKETIPSMDGDVLFYFVTEQPGQNEAAKVVEEWMNDPLFQNLNVAKNNKLVQVDEAIWNTAGGYQAANLLLDEIVAYFTAEK
ncbi:AraC family transcriptional regulator [Paenibacillus sp. SYP-B4298]|uniref:AraC family transcriptional regulator n=1 Tax=Paenibacillus sp. SYP-B4298 TaxID=2996034 RepID=UPI0022DE5E32|nr:AraC family transcriptional regulator [Paenibacillus sp. SYP-B4298]